MTQKNNIFLFSVDLEDVRENVKDGHKYSDRVRTNTERYLGWLKKTNSHCTFFTVGKIAERHPDLIREISAQGHEIAAHSYSHIPVGNLGEKEFKNDLEKNISVLVKAGASNVKGFRAPVFSMTQKTTWAYRAMADLGITYSSSVLPAKNPLFGWEGFGYESKKMDGNVLEIPMTVNKFGPLTLPVAGGVYFRALPTTLLYAAVKKCVLQGRPVLSYFHPYDADTEQERFMHAGINESRFYNWLMYYNRRNLFKRLNGLLKLDLKIITYTDYISHYLKN